MWAHPGLVAERVQGLQSLHALLCCVCLLVVASATGVTHGQNDGARLSNSPSSVLAGPSLIMVGNMWTLLSLQHYSRCRLRHRSCGRPAAGLLNTATCMVLMCHTQQRCNMPPHLTDPATHVDWHNVTSWTAHLYNSTARPVLSAPSTQVPAR
jgi:hypothetical protein